jgi:hypothetical protein
MVDSGEQARKFQEFYQRFTDDYSSRWQDAFQSFIRFQKQLAAQYDRSLADQKKGLHQASNSDFAKLMMSSYLSAVAFQREQMGILNDTQTNWNDMYRQFLDSLDKSEGVKTPDAPH